MTYCASAAKIMASASLGHAERAFILHGIQDDLRLDGRGREEYRCMELETDVVSNTNGSARLKLLNTDILVGIKADIGVPSPERPHEGKLEFFLDCSANATPEFEGRGGETLATEITSVLMRAYDSADVLDLKSLCIIPGEQCWVLYIDVVLLECGGNLFDASSIAVKAAIFNTKIPTVTVSRGEGNETELEISDDPYDCKRLDVQNAPCVVTVSKIGHSHIVDATMEEEACCLATLMMGVAENGRVTALKKAGSGSLDPESLTEMMESGKSVGQHLNQKLHEVLAADEKLGPSKRRVGFLGR